MIHIYIFADSHKHFDPACGEYIKRLGKTMKIHEIKPVKHGTPEGIIKKETQELIKRLENHKGYKVILSPTGRSLSTEKFTNMIEQQKNGAQDIMFCIGGANGLDYDALREHIDYELSLSFMTLPHSLAFTVLLEQIYRASEIEKGSGYHK